MRLRSQLKPNLCAHALPSQSVLMEGMAWSYLATKLFGLLSSPGLEQREDRAFLVCLRSVTSSVLVLGQVVQI